jgi:hypothetical protein
MLFVDSGDEKANSGLDSAIGVDAKLTIDVGLGAWT